MCYIFLDWPLGKMIQKIREVFAIFIRVMPLVYEYSDWLMLNCIAMNLRHNLETNLPMWCAD